MFVCWNKIKIVEVFTDIKTFYRWKNFMERVWTSDDTKDSKPNEQKSGFVLDTDGSIDDHQTPYTWHLES
jgi:hypothetical protein